MLYYYGLQAKQSACQQIFTGKLLCDKRGAGGCNTSALIYEFHLSC